MKKSALFLLLITVFASVIFAQTTDKTSENTDYSESKSNKERPELKLSKRVRNAQKKKKEKILNQKSSEIADDVIKIDSTLVTISVTVYDRQGNYVSDLTKGNFKVFEDGEEQEIAYFGTNDKPIYVALLFDTSRSLSPKRTEIENAAKAFVSKLKPEDQVAVIQFNKEYRVLTEFTNDRKKINKGIESLDYAGKTVLYETVGFTVDQLFGEFDGRKAMVLFTDGVDTDSVKIRHDDSLLYAQESGATVFPIYYNTYRPNMAGIFGFFVKGDSLEEYEIGKKYLDQLAERTGGKLTDTGVDAVNLTKAFESIAEELRRQYFIGYYTKEEGEIGEEREIKVRINRQNLAIRARDSYIFGGNIQLKKKRIKFKLF